MPAGHINLRQRAEHNKKVTQRAGSANPIPKADQVKKQDKNEVKSTLALIGLVVIVGGLLWQMVDLIVRRLDAKGQL